MNLFHRLTLPDSTPDSGPSIALTLALRAAHVKRKYNNVNIINKIIHSVQENWRFFDFLIANIEILQIRNILAINHLYLTHFYWLIWERLEELEVEQ